MKKALLITGIGLAGFGLYRYFKHQVNLALNYEYKLEDFHIDKSEGNKVYVTVTMSIKNKSNFQITITEYNLDLFFKGVLFANTKSQNVLIINPETNFKFTTQGVIDLDTVKVAVLPFIQDVLKRKPIDFEISGYIKTIFFNIPSTIKFDKQKVNYSVDLLKDTNLDAKFEKLKAKYPKLFSILKI